MVEEEVVMATILTVVSCSKNFTFKMCMKSHGLHVDIFWVNIFAHKHNNCVTSLDGQYVYMHSLVKLQS